MVPTPLLTNLCNTCYFSLCSKRNDYPAHPFFFRRGGGPGLNLTTAPLHRGVAETLEGSCGTLKLFPRLPKTCWALPGPDASPEGPRGAARDLLPGLAVAHTAGVPGGLRAPRQRCLTADPLELAIVETAAVSVQDIISLHKPCCSAYVDDTKRWDKAVLIRDIQRANTSLLAQAVMLDVLPSEVHRIAAVATCCSCFAERLWI